MKLTSLIAIALFIPLMTEWKTLDTTEFSIRYPADWELNQSGASGTSFFLLSPNQPDQIFRNNVNLIIQDLTGMSIDLDEYVAISEDQVKQFITSSSMIRSERVGKKHVLEYSGAQGQFSLRWLQYMWISNNRAFVLTFTADQVSYGQAISLSQEIMDSFRIK